MSAAVLVTALRFCRENTLLVMTIVSVILGVSLGFGLRPLSLSAETLQLINFPGEITRRNMTALAQMDAKQSGQMGLATVLYYLTTTVLATLLGIFLVMTIHPGDPSIKAGTLPDVPVDTEVSPLDTFLDLVRNMFPENIIQATFERVHTMYVVQKPRISKNTSDDGVIMKKAISTTHGMNILGIIVFCTGFGIVISQLGERARIVVDFFVILDAVIMRWVETLMCYVFTVLAGLILHAVITCPALYFLITRKNPMFIVRGMMQAIVTAFGTASGGAALPMSMQCMEDNCHDGNALYEAVAVIFIAQLNSVDLSLAEVITVSVTATVASIGLGSVPAGLVSILLILNTVGLPIKDVSLLLTVDWLL
ncbi:unnamed protein product [Angiostrongylus costaricensis]|uniref:Amino acid transporter n=1 Tax=Angiostrongylus costaricensis TaxID=334426 RepID=A0A158PLC2_ANGCS|nr:unnamed protein product [Angiostrongylus costaricensis]